jgi:hypothetical protein
VNWRIGVIAKRGLKVDGKARYLIQPLSNPMQHQPEQEKAEAQLRPWLAWTAPGTTLPALKNLQFGEVEWDRVVRGDFDAGEAFDYIVDGSILAAKAVDSSYSLFTKDTESPTATGEVLYKGTFLGAEKIWTGEPVRMRRDAPREIVVLIIDQIVLSTTSTSNNTVVFVGNEYKLIEDQGQPRPDPAILTQLPPRMLADLQFRNQAAAKLGHYFDWRLLERGARRDISQIKGRWYETRTLLPILRGEQKFQEDVASGRPLDAGDLMNARKDNNPVSERQMKNRKETLGGSVPSDFLPSRGLDSEEKVFFPDERLAGGMVQQYDPGLTQGIVNGYGF